jgi:hypothetical protein
MFTMLTLHITGFSALEALELIYAGLEARHRTVTEKINELKGQIAAAGDGYRSVRRSSLSPDTKPLPKPAKHHQLSKSARQRIADAQRLRWKRHHREQRAREKAKAAPAARKSKPKPRQEPRVAVSEGSEA